jgi:hypothetical protein
MWVARDQDGQLYLHMFIKPWRASDGSYEWPNQWLSGNGAALLDETLFPDLRWTDEPWEVELKAV